MMVMKEMVDFPKNLSGFANNLNRCNRNPAFSLNNISAFGAKFGRLGSYSSRNPFLST